MATRDICHFCSKDYTHAYETYLLEGPAHEAQICEQCVFMATSHIHSKQETNTSNRRCDVCGQSSESLFYGQAPTICENCIKITVEIILSLKGTQHAETK